MPVQEASPPSLSLAHAVERQFVQIQDPLCRIDTDRSPWESLKLYPATDYVADGSIVHDVRLNRPVNPVEYPVMPLVSFKAAGSQFVYWERGGQVFEHKAHEQAGRLRGDLLDYGPALGPEPMSAQRAAPLFSLIHNLVERPQQLYLPQEPTDEWSWSAHYVLPEPVPREAALDLIYTAVQSLQLNANIPPEDAVKRGVSGVLVGPNDAESVEEIWWARDPSRRHGVWEMGDNDMFVARLAGEHGWTEADGTEFLMENWVRTIMGRNKDLYAGGSAFTLEETRALLLPDSPLSISGGYLFSCRPGWDAPYGESAAITTAEVWPGDTLRIAEIVRHMSDLGWCLNRQNRWVLETLHYTQAFSCND